MAAGEIIHLIDSGEYYQPIRTGTEIPQPLIETVENFVEVADGKVIFDMIYDVMTVNLLPQQETEFVRKSFLALLGPDVEWTFSSTLVFHEQEVSYSMEGKETQTYAWSIIRDILARCIEQDNYPDSKSDLLPVEKLIEFPWFQRLAFQYRELLEQSGEEPTVEIPYLESDIEKENAKGKKEEVPENEKSDILKAVYYDVTRAFSLHSIALIPSKPLIQSFFEQAGEKEKQEFLSGILELQSKRDYGRSALNTEQGVVHYTFEKGTVDFQLMHGEREGHGRFTMQEVVRAIQEAIDTDEYLAPGEYDAAVNEGFSLCPEENYQLYKEMKNRNQSISQASDFFYPDEWEFPSGDKTKYKSNVAAIRLLKELEQSSRPATPEEQIILARYVGWGGLANAFNPKSPNWVNEYQEMQELLTVRRFNNSDSKTVQSWNPVWESAIFTACCQRVCESHSFMELSWTMSAEGLQNSFIPMQPFK